MELDEALKILNVSKDLPREEMIQVYKTSAKHFKMNFICIEVSKGLST